MTTLLQKDLISSVGILLLSIIGSQVRPKLPIWVSSYLAHPATKLLILTLFCFYAMNKSPQVALTMALAYYLLFIFLKEKKIEEEESS